MLLLQAVVDGRQAVDDVRNGQQLLVVGQFVLLKSVLCHVEVQQVHCGQTGQGTEEPLKGVNLINFTNE